MEGCTVLKKQDGNVIGVDFGTLSARAVVADISNGHILGVGTCEYPHGVITEGLPAGWALADPEDYLSSLIAAIREAFQTSHVSPESILGIGLNATASTFLPVDEACEPLSRREAFRDHPHARMKLWKHHGASREADALTAVAEERHEDFLARCGGKINAEWMVPKLLETFREDPEVFSAADAFIEIGDYLVFKLTGKRTLSDGYSGYKMLLRPGEPSISPAYLDAVEPGFSRILTKRKGMPAGIGTLAGFLTPEMAETLGLVPGVPVAAGNIDAHAAIPASGITSHGTMVVLLGTSCCSLTIHPAFHPVEGAFGIVRDGMLPGFYGYESGQNAGGDMLSWFVRNAVPAEYIREAECRGISIHDLLTEKASALRPGQSGLLVLDWFNGNRSVLANMDLTGLILGLTLKTRPEEIYRAMIEGLAFGLKAILEAHAKAGVEIRELAASGGISYKNPLFLQIYADVTGLPIRRLASPEGPALGSAICAAAASCAYPDLAAAARAMGGLETSAVLPQAGNHAGYEKLYSLWLRLHDAFGRGSLPVMAELISLSKE